MTGQEIADLFESAHKLKDGEAIVLSLKHDLEDRDLDPSSIKKVFEEAGLPRAKFIILNGLEVVKIDGSEDQAMVEIRIVMVQKKLTCRGCGEELDSANHVIADGCPCNSKGGLNHGLVPEYVCCCDKCFPDSNETHRYARKKPESWRDRPSLL